MQFFLIYKKDVQGKKYLVLLDPFADEEIKKGYYDEQRWINADIRDNIWLCDLEVLERELEAGVESISKKRIVTADIKALARYMGIDGDKMYFRAKEFRTGIEKICSYDVFTNSIAIEAELKAPENGKTVFIIEEKPFSVFSVTQKDYETKVKGIINSNAELSYDNKLGQFISCIDNRYVVTRNTLVDEQTGDYVTSCSIYDSVEDRSESYVCKCMLKGSTLVLY